MGREERRRRFCIGRRREEAGEEAFSFLKLLKSLGVSDGWKSDL